MKRDDQISIADSNHVNGMPSRKGQLSPWLDLA
jgi:hypothetical protein